MDIPRENAPVTDLGQFMLGIGAFRLRKKSDILWMTELTYHQCEIEVFPK